MNEDILSEFIYNPTVMFINLVLEPIFICYKHKSIGSRSWNKEIDKKYSKGFKYFTFVVRLY